MITKRAFARVGLMGNPSDGFYGKTLSTCISNFWAEVLITESRQIQFAPHTTHDCTQFASLDDMVHTALQFGYYGGLRLVWATCKRFTEYCRSRGIELDSRNYTIAYDTNIPRQVGLGGSSAIIVALWKALMEFYGLSNKDIPLEIQPNLVLSVESEELEIVAGLQDRVVQTYGGTVFMDFDRRVVESMGHGIYERIDSGLLPSLFVAYVSSPGKTSGKMHNMVRFRFNRGDTKVLEAMATFAGYATKARQALVEGDHGRFVTLMDMNFELRLHIYGDDLIGERNIRMVQIAHNLGASAKFPGSGGAVVGAYFSPGQCGALREVYEREGYKFVDVVIDSG